MIRDAVKSNGIAAHAASSAAVKGGETEKELETLKKQASEIAEILSGAKDSVAISDEARALSQAAANTANTSGKTEASAQSVDAPEDDIAEQPAAAAQKTLGSREGRNAIAAEYNAVLEELRGQYGEAEAMRRFDDFMASEGFERVTEDGGAFGGVRASGGVSGMLRAFAGASLSTAGMPHIPSEQLTSNLSANSILRGAFAGGEVRYFAETHANFGANVNQDVIDALSGLYQTNLESALSGTSIDLAGYMEEHFNSNPQTSVISASEDLGAVAAKLLRAAGIDLGENGVATFSMKEDGSGLYVASAVIDDYEAAQNAVDAALRRNPDMLKAFRDEYNSAALTDTSALGGAYSDGAHSVEYGDVSRSFTYSAKEPSVAVMTDYVDVTVTGYNYRKKVSDSFDTDSDFHSVLDGGVRLTFDNGRVGLDPEDLAANQKINRQMKEDITRAIETGEDIASTMTRGEYDAVQEARSAGFVDPETLAAGGKLYSAAPDAEEEQAQKAAEARRALLDLESDPRMRDREIPYVDEWRKARKATVSQLLEQFGPGRRTPGLNMINSVMSFFKGL